MASHADIGRFVAGVVARHMPFYYPERRSIRVVTGKLAIMGNIVVEELDATKQTYPMALLITFESAEDIRQALKDMECKFSFCEKPSDGAAPGEVSG